MFHALTGCNMVSCFAGHGKRTAWAVWTVLPELTQTLTFLSTAPDHINDAHNWAVHHTALRQNKPRNRYRQGMSQPICKEKQRPAIPPTRAALEQHAADYVTQHAVWWYLYTAYLCTPASCRRHPSWVFADAHRTGRPHQLDFACRCRLIHTSSSRHPACVYAPAGLRSCWYRKGNRNGKRKVCTRWKNCTWFFVTRLVFIRVNRPCLTCFWQCNKMSCWNIYRWLNFALVAKGTYVHFRCVKMSFWVFIYHDCIKRTLNEIIHGRYF